MQALGKTAAIAVISRGSLPAALSCIQSAGAGQIYQRHGSKRSERKRIPAFALIVLPNTGRDCCDVGNIANHPGPNPGFRIVTAEDGKAGSDLARAVAANDGIEVFYAGCRADCPRGNQLGDAKRDRKVTESPG